MKTPHSPSSMPSWHVDPPVPEYRGPTSPSPNSFDEMRLRDDFRQTKKNLFNVIVDWDKVERSLSSLTGQMKTAKPAQKAQLESQCTFLNKKASKLKKTYHKLKQRVYLIDKEMKSLPRRNKVFAQTQ